LGGYAIFFEPFESGNIMLRNIIDKIIKDERSTDIKQNLTEFLKAIVIDIDARIGPDKSAERYKYMDDKWIFTPGYFAEVTQQIGYRECDIYSINVHPLFENQLRVLISFISMSPEALPEWSWDIARSCDKEVSLEQQKVFMDGCVILKK
jgi:hypothetical protein